VKQREMDILTKHFDTYFGQNDCKVLHPVVMEPHVDALLYKPNDAYPYWKLVTMGASDYKMAANGPSLGNRNEYIMFIDPEENMEDSEVANWYFGQLMEVALYPFHSGKHITYGHSVQWQPEAGEEMVCAFLEMPQVVADVGILRCKLGLLKQTVCLQVILLTREETDQLLEMGPEAFSNYLYPEEGRSHFLCQRHRTEKF